MKEIIYFLFIIISSIAFQSCNSDNKNQETQPIELIGELGKLNAKILLYKNGDKYWGDFLYTGLEKPEIKLEGVKEGEKLILREFNENNDLKGVFEGYFKNGNFKGYWRNPGNERKVSFSFSANANDFTLEPQREIESNSNKHNLASLNPKELIKIHFNPFKFVDSKSAFYRNSKGTFEVNYEKIEKYKIEKIEYAIVFFSNYEHDENYGRNESHAASGVVSVAKYKERNGKWELMKFKHECECGYGDWGNINLPKLKKYGDYYFIVSESGSLHQGFSQSYFSVCNTDDFNASAKLVASASNLAALPEKGEELEYDSDISFEPTGKQLLMRVKYHGNDYDYSTKTRIDMNKTDVYYFDQKKLKFKKNE